jgi:2,3-bisphosphoglycerate-independent phosphoglycerate mutase
MTLPPGPAQRRRRSLCLVVLDGWGLAPPGPGNAVELAHTPVFDELWASYPHTQLIACGRAVGLPEGQMGNSEVGHLNLGAGAVMRQDLTRLDDAMNDGHARRESGDRAALGGSGRVHLIGLVSDGGVHSSEEHLLALIARRRAGRRRRRRALLHRRPRHRADAGLEASSARGGGRRARIGQSSGATSRWTATSAGTANTARLRPARARRGAHTAASGSRGGRAPPTSAARPTSSSSPRWSGRPRRSRPAIASSASTSAPTGCARSCARWPTRLHEVDRGGVATLGRAEHADDRVRGGLALSGRVRARAPHDHALGVIAAAGARQLHVAETEKYPHVTYFFNGGEEQPSRASGASSSLAARRPDLRPQAADERARGAAAFVGAWSEAVRASRSSTSPTPTWSATPA